MKTIELHWVETAQRSIAVNVPDDFDADAYGMDEMAAEFDDDASFDLVRDQFAADDIEFDADAVRLDGDDDDDDDDDDDQLDSEG